MAAVDDRVMTEESPTTPQADTSRLSPYTWYVVGLLTLVYAVHTMDRQVLAVLLEPIKAEMALTDTDLGFLAGISYAVAFAIAGIPLGMLCDRVNRRKLLAGLIALWSVLTSLSALAQTYRGLIFARMGVGLAEAGGMPVALSLIGDYVPRSRRSTAAGIFMSGTGLGALVGMATASYVAATYGWRAAFVVVGLPGVVLAVIVLMTLREPERRKPTTAAEGNGAASLSKVLAFVCSQPSQVLIISGTVMAVLANAGIATWITSFLIRVHGLGLAHAGTATALVSGLTMTLGSLAGAWLTDRFGRHDLRRQPRFAAVATLAAAVAIIGAAFAASAMAAIALAALWALCFPALHAATFGLSTSLAPARMRGTTIGLLAVLNNIVGYGLGPQIVGFLSDFYGASFGSNALRYAIASVAVCYVISAVLLLLASGPRLLQDLESAGD